MSASLSQAFRDGPGLDLRTPTFTVRRVRDPDVQGSRLFTISEANALLPELRLLLGQLQRARERVLDAQRRLRDRFHGGPRANGHATPGGEMVRLTGAAQEAQEDIARAVQAIAELGCELKDPERGMVDFRTERDGRTVYLCWLINEPRILYWHELNAGYRGRQALD